MLLNILAILFVILLFLAAFLLVRTVMATRPPAPQEQITLVDIDPRGPVEHLARAIRCQTISVPPGSGGSYQAFEDLHQALEMMYLHVHAKLALQKIAGYSLLYLWPGSNPELDPVLLAAHQDVVPTPEDTLAQWTYPPFSGEISEGFVWGRGTLDCKNQVISILEAVEWLLENNYQPERSIYLAFGHDEEIGGRQGAAAMAAWLESRGVHLAAVLDEGGSVESDSLPGVNIPVALIGTAEKGHLTVQLTAEGTPGHSATPPAHTTIGILAQAITQIENNPMPVHLAAVLPTLLAAAPAMSFFDQMKLANTWLFGGSLRRSLLSRPRTAAMVRTTSAVTIVKGGVKDNVIPATAEASVNCRLLPGDTIAGACDHLRKVINDPRIKLEVAPDSAREATQPSPVDSPEFNSLASVTQRAFGVLVVPNLVLGGTDARHYSVVCDNIFRFSPQPVNSGDNARVHGIDERIEVDALVGMVKYFVELIRTWGTEL